MNYGSKTEDAVIMPVVGILDSNSIVNMELNESGTRFTITYKQPNGSLVKVSEFEGNEEWQVEGVNRRMKHIATKVVSNDEWDVSIKETSSFSDFISKVMNLIGHRYEGMTFNMLFIYNKKGYVTTPSYPNFIEVSGNTPTILSINAYNAKMMTKPEVTKTPVAEDFPF